MFSINTLFSAVCKVKRRSKVKLHILWLWKDKDFFSQLTIWFLFCCIRLQQLSMSPLTALLSHFLCARVTSNFFLHILSFSFLAIFNILYFFIFFFSLFVSVINKRWALYFMQYILVAKHYFGKTSDKYCNTCFLFGRRVKPSGGDNLFIRLNGKTWLEAKNWVTLSSWRHQRFNGFSNFQIIQHQNLWLFELYIFQIFHWKYIYWGDWIGLIEVLLFTSTYFWWIGKAMW